MRKIQILLMLFSSILWAEIQYIVPKAHFGNIEKKDMLKTHIFIKNKGEQFVHIDKIETSCGCVHVAKQKDWIMPEKTTRLEITIVPPFEKFGQNFWYINIFTSTKENKLIVFEANVESSPKIKKIASKIQQFLKVITWILLY